MAYFLKVEILSGYSTSETQFREVEFYNNSTKISISELSVIDGSSVFVSYPLSKLIDGNTNYNTSILATSLINSYPKYFILKSNLEFNKIKIYADAQNGYAPKDIAIYSLKSEDTPTRDDEKWKLDDTRTYDNGLTEQEHNIHFTKKRMLLQSNGKAYSLESINITHETTMTSNNTPAPLVASSSNQYNTSQAPYMAFNGTLSGSDDCWASSNTDSWLKLDFGKKTYVNEISMFYVNTTVTTYAMKDFKIQASNNDVNWITLLDVKNQTSWTAKQERVFKFENINPYRYYRIYGTASNGATYFAIGLLVFKYNGFEISELFNPSLDNFTNYGMNSSLEKLNSIFVSKNYVLQDTVSEDVDGLWGTQLNRKPLSIKFD